MYTAHKTVFLSVILLPASYQIGPTSGLFVLILGASPILSGNLVNVHFYYEDSQFLIIVYHLYKKTTGLGSFNSLDRQQKTQLFCLLSVPARLQTAQLVSLLFHTISSPSLL